MRVCVCACAHARVRARASHACMRAYVLACMLVCVCVCVRARGAEDAMMTFRHARMQACARGVNTWCEHMVCVYVCASSILLLSSCPLISLYHPLPWFPLVYIPAHSYPTLFSTRTHFYSPILLSLTPRTQGRPDKNRHTEIRSEHRRTEIRYVILHASTKHRRTDVRSATSAHRRSLCVGAPTFAQRPHMKITVTV